MKRAIVSFAVAMLVVARAISGQQADLNRPPWSWFDRVRHSEGEHREIIDGCALVDLDGDGDLDLVLRRSHTWMTGDSSAAAKGVDVRAFLNDGKGAFAPTKLEPLTSEVWPVGGFDWADCDADGDADAVLWDPDGRKVRVYRNSGAGKMARVELPAGVRLTGPCAWVRFREGVLLAGKDGADVCRLDCSGAGVRSVARLPIMGGDKGVTTGPGAWGDCDGDGDPDLIGWSTATLQHCLLVNDGKALQPLLIDCPQDESKVDIFPAVTRWADLDADGLQDVVFVVEGPPMDGYPETVLHNTGGKLECLEGALGGTPPSGQHTDVAIADFDGDGDPDLFVNASINSRSYLAENLGGMRFATHPFGRPGDDLPDAGGWAVTCGDVNGDGRPDLVGSLEDFGFDVYLGRDPRSGPPTGWE
jgi:hypothetical protein